MNTDNNIKENGFCVGELGTAIPIPMAGELWVSFGGNECNYSRSRFGWLDVECPVMMSNLETKNMQFVSDLSPSFRTNGEEIGTAIEKNNGNFQFNPQYIPISVKPKGTLTVSDAQAKLIISAGFGKTMVGVFNSGPSTNKKIRIEIGPFDKDINVYLSPETLDKFNCTSTELDRTFKCGPFDLGPNENAELRMIIAYPKSSIPHMDSIPILGQSELGNEKRELVLNYF